MNNQTGLMHPRDGYIAEHIRGRQGASEASEIQALREEVERLNRLLVTQPKALRSIRLESHATEIIPGTDGVLAFSTDEYLEWQRDPNGGLHHGKLSLDLAALVLAISEYPGFIDWICQTCSGAEPGPWPGG